MALPFNKRRHLNPQPVAEVRRIKLRKIFGSVVLCLSVASTAFAASNPKATGDATWPNSTDSTSANLTFNALATSPVPLQTGSYYAKGSAIYTDENVQYSMDVKYVSFDAAHTHAWFVGQITSVTGAFGGCCQVGHWVLYEVFDGGEPGIGVDAVFGEDLTQGENITDEGVAAQKVYSFAPPMGGPFVITDGNIQVH